MIHVHSVNWIIRSKTLTKIQDWVIVKLDCNSTTLRPFDDLRYNVTPMTFDKQSNSRRSQI